MVVSKGAFEEFLPNLRRLRHVRAHASKARRGPDHEPVGGRLVAERVSTGQHFIGDDRNSPQIPRRKRLLAEPLFRRHVAGRAQKRARSGVSSALLRSGRKEFGDAKVQHLGNIPPLTAHLDDTSTPSVARLPRGMTAIGIFLFFGALVASLAGITLVWRGTALDRMWTLNPRAHNELAPLGQPMGLLFLSLAVALALAGTGWLKRRRWDGNWPWSSSELRFWGMSQTFFTGGSFKAWWASRLQAHSQSSSHHAQIQSTLR